MVATASLHRLLLLAVYVNRLYLPLGVVLTACSLYKLAVSPVRSDTNCLQSV